MSKQPIGFMSYVRFDDAHNDGRITEFCDRLKNEVKTLLGSPFDIFQDKTHISWGQQWKQRLDESIDASTFLIPIITPSFFNSEACRDEVMRFLAREKELGRNDLILPVYYVKCKVLDDKDKRKQDPLAEIIASHNVFDWRDMRFEPSTNPDVWKAFSRMAQQIVDAMDRDVVFQAPLVVAGEIADEVDGASESASEVDSSQARAESRQPAEKSEPPTHIVDALHRGDFTTLGEALGIAKAGDRILIRPGTYREAIVIDKPLEIIGDGSLGEVVIESKGKATVKFQASMGRLSNLVLRQAGGGKYFCVDILQGRLDVDGCDISSVNLSGVSVRAGATPQLRRNSIHGCGQSGVFLRENSSGTFEDNKIFRNAYSNVVVTTGANPTIRRNRIYESKQSGVSIQEEGLGIFEDNEIFANERSAVVVGGGSNPVFRRNRLYESKIVGVRVDSGSFGIFDDNEIFSNGESGVVVSNKAAPQLRGNDVHNNTHSGVQVCFGGEPGFYRNNIRDNKQAGVFLHSDGCGLFERNSVTGNGFNGFLIKGRSKVTLNNNVVTMNGKYGVLIRDGSEVSIQNNDLRDNKFGPYHLDEDCLPSVTKEGNTEK
ncbi:right-handed parallel beta-helix repeat-containing protein [Pseudomonas nunensis]|uniref:right-handed parallel beta-helix repeat-containing protein n=1 Tax=Pseudomonas nunensis TaxID=2961896 RepID=UPI0025AEF149|nr:right-handed parallel beta-helix repeat-containing protein [Pseudomonas nunensis]MDN3222988.1 right-handed parallel beta-helix repeat-containing protein [Pseudomonas nunensis]